jgi:hypothetical protein
MWPQGSEINAGGLVDTAGIRVRKVSEIMGLSMYLRQIIPALPALFRGKVGRHHQHRNLNAIRLRPAPGQDRPRRTRSREGITGRIA